MASCDAIPPMTAATQCSSPAPKRHNSPTKSSDIEAGPELLSCTMDVAMCFRAGISPSTSLQMYRHDTCQCSQHSKAFLIAFTTMLHLSVVHVCRCRMLCGSHASVFLRISTSQDCRGISQGDGLGCLRWPHLSLTPEPMVLIQTSSFCKYAAYYMVAYWSYKPG